MTPETPPPSDDLLWRHLKTLPAFRALLRAVEARFYQVVDLPQPMLDVGCGDGDFVQHTFKEFGRRPDIGVDPWWESLRHTIDTDLYGGVTQAWGDRMPFSDETFASAYSNSVLEHIPDIQPVLNETARVLQTGGRFLMTMPNHRFTECLGGAHLFERVGLSSAADLYRQGFNRISRHAHTEGIEWWAEKCAAAGLAIERWQYYFSVDALRALEIGHAQGVPSAITRALTGHWIIAPTRESLALTDRWLRPYYLEQADANGTYLLIVARKVAHQRPIDVHIPEARPFEVSPTGDLIPDEAVDLPEVALAQVEAEPELVGAAEAEVSLPLTEAESEAEPLAIPRPAFSPADLIRYGIRAGQLLLAFIAYSIAQATPWIGLIFWLIAIGLIFYPARGQEAVEGAETDVEKSADTAGFPIEPFIQGGILFLIALVLRSTSLSTHPFVLSGTEADFGLTSVRLLNGSQQSLFGFGPLSNPALPLYIQGLPLLPFGRTVLGIRALSPVIGALTVLAVYLFGRRIWSPVVGIVAATLLAGSHTHLHYSRLGLTNVWDPLLMVLGIGFLILAWQTGRRGYWVALACTIGFSAFFFTAGRLLLPVVAVTLLLYLLSDPRKWLKNLPHIGLTLFFALVIALPIVRGYRANPTLWTERYNLVGIRPQSWVDREMAATGETRNRVLIDQAWSAFAAFNGGEDTSLYYGASRPMVGFTIGLLFLIGIFVVAFEPTRLEHFPLWVTYLGTAFGAMLLISPVASHRYLVAFPAVMLLAGIGVDRGVRWFAERFSISGRAAMVTVQVAVFLLAGLLVFPDLRFYLGEYQANPAFTDVNTEVAHRIGEYLQTIPPTTDVYMVTRPRLTADFPNIRFLADAFRPGQNLIDLGDSGLLLSTLADAPDGPKQVIGLPENGELLSQLQTSYPEGRLTVVQGEFSDTLFWVLDLQEG